MPTLFMQISKVDKNDTTVVSIKGSFESGNAAFVENELRRVIATAKNVVLDFAELDYISSSGLQVLLVIQKACQAKGIALKIINVNDVVNEVFRVTGFNNIIKIVQ